MIRFRAFAAFLCTTFIAGLSFFCVKREICIHTALQLARSFLAPSPRYCYAVTLRRSIYYTVDFSLLHSLNGKTGVFCPEIWKISPKVFGHNIAVDSVVKKVVAGCYVSTDCTASLGVEI